MKVRVIPIPDILKMHVECIRIAEHDSAEGLALNVCLNGLPGIVFQHHQGRSPVESIATASSLTTCIPTLFVYGQMTEVGVMHYRKEQFSTLQVILKPHALQTLLGMNASALTNGIAELNEFSSEDLNMQLLEARGEQERIAFITNFLRAKLNQSKPKDRLIEESLRLIHQNAGSVTVKCLLEHLNLSERQFEKRFSQAVGLTPHFYIRVKRFNKAIRLMKTGQFGTLTQLAHSLNFYDQSHFIRDIKAFSGITPTELIQKVDDLQSEHPVIAYV